MIDKARELSVSNLQRLYTIVMSLAVAESLRRLLSDYGDKGQLPEFASIVAVFSLLITAIPFYHGANRYLESTYITGERKAKPKTLIFDFIALFVEGLVFFILAVVIKNTTVFFTTLAILFIIDSIWVGFTYLTTIEKSRTPNIRAWAIANVIASICLLVFVWSNLLGWNFWSSKTATSIALGATALIRTGYDYYSTWDFYFPSDKKADRTAFASSKKQRKSN
jgi:hypothetical protein